MSSAVNTTCAGASRILGSRSFLPRIDRTAARPCSVPGSQLDRRNLDVDRLSRIDHLCQASFEAFPCETVLRNIAQSGSGQDSLFDLCILVLERCEQWPQIASWCYAESISAGVPYVRESRCSCRSIGNRHLPGLTLLNGLCVERPRAERWREEIVTRKDSTRSS